MCRLGNGRVNAILEYEVPDHVKKPTPVTSRSVSYYTLYGTLYKGQYFKCSVNLEQ